jgi:hypothetical protein
LEGGWFSGNIRSILGDGNDIGFWKDKWLGSATLRNCFQLSSPNRCSPTILLWPWDLGIAIFGSGTLNNYCFDRNRIRNSPGFILIIRTNSAL